MSTATAAAPAPAVDAEAIAELLAAELGLEYSSLVVDLLWFPTQGITRVTEAAAEYGIGVKLLRKRMGGYPHPRVLLQFGRVVAGLKAYAEGAPSVEHAAMTSSGWDAAQLTHRCDHLTGLRPKAWRDAGADYAELVRRLAQTWRARGEDWDGGGPPERGR